MAAAFRRVTSARTAAPAMALVVMLGLAAAAWVVAVRQMDGMDMGVATELGSFVPVEPARAVNSRHFIVV
jgi:hypothetical protein